MDRSTTQGWKRTMLFDSEKKGIYSHTPPFRTKLPKNQWNQIFNNRSKIIMDFWDLHLTCSRRQCTKGYYRPPFSTQHSLTLDIAISLYLITVFPFLYFIAQVLHNRGTSVMGQGWCPKQLVTTTAWHGGIPSLLHFSDRPKTMYTLVDYMGVSLAHFHGDLEWNWRQRGNMVICFTGLIRHVGDCLHLAPLILWSWATRTMGLNLETYKI